MARGSGAVAGAAAAAGGGAHAQGGELPAQGADGGGRVVETRTQLLVQPAALLLRLPHARDGLARRLAQSCHLALQVQRAVALAPLERGELSTKHVLAHPELSPASPLRGVSTPLGGELLQRALQRVGLLPERMPHRLTLVMHVKECFLRRGSCGLPAPTATLAAPLRRSSTMSPSSRFSSTSAAAGARTPSMRKRRVRNHSRRAR